VQKIPLELAKAGMVLAKPVLRSNGLVLIGENAELTDPIIARLKQMDIDAVVVQGNPLDLEGVGSGTPYNRILERMDHLFRKYEGEQDIMLVKSRLRDYFQLKAAAEAAKAAKAAEEAKAAKEALVAEEEDAQNAKDPKLAAKKRA
jgi:translation initiation factor IF-2